MSKQLNKTDRERLFDVIGEGHSLFDPIKISKICKSLDIPFPDHLVRVEKTRYFSCETHGWNIGNALECEKAWQKGERMDLEACCSEGWHLGKYMLEMNDDDGNLDLTGEYDCIDAGSFNSWLAYHYEVDQLAYKGFHGRGSQARAYGNEVIKHLRKIGYLPIK